jgi:hypothetical protein
VVRNAALNDRGQGESNPFTALQITSLNRKSFALYSTLKSKVSLNACHLFSARFLYFKLTYTIKEKNFSLPGFFEDFIQPVMPCPEHFQSILPDFNSNLS